MLRLPRRLVAGAAAGSIAGDAIRAAYRPIVTAPGPAADARHSFAVFRMVPTSER
jgi:hypothetical protein